MYLMKTDHKNLDEYLTWLAAQCAKDFDNDQDLINAGISVSEDILFEKKTLALALKDSLSKEDSMKKVISMLNAGVTLLSLAPHMVFHCATLSCAYCWIRDN